MNRLRVVFDGNNTAYRANCVNELCTKSGLRTSAIVGVLNITHAVMEELNKKLELPVAEVIYAWDFGHSERRKALFPEYKANRKKEKTEDEKLWMKEFIDQANTLNEALPFFGIKCIKKAGWEGDDLIYGVTEALKKKYPDDRVIIVSTDEDFHQLVQDNVNIYSPIKKILYTQKNYQRLMGIPQDRFLTYKILKGDSSDGIGGIPGIGEKTAKSLVNQYGKLENLLSAPVHMELMKSKRTQKIFTLEGLQTLDRNNKLINLKDYVDLSDIEDDINELIAEEPLVDGKLARNFLMKYQITSILVKWGEWIEPFEEMTGVFDD